MGRRNRPHSIQPTMKSIVEELTPRLSTYLNSIGRFPNDE